MARLLAGVALAVAAVWLPVSLGGALVPAAAATAAQPASAPAWAVDPAASRLTFQSSVGGAQFTGAFQRWQAAIRFDPKNLAASSVLVKVDMTSARTGAAERDEALPGADWFAASQYGQATFAAKSFKDLGGGRYQAAGTLTMRGVSRPLTFTFMLRIDGAQARMTGDAVIDRHVFGVGQGQFAGADSIPFAVAVKVALAARRL